MKKMQHYFDNFTSIKNANCIAEKAQHPGKHIQKANTNIGNNHLCKNVSPGFKARSKPGQLALDNNSQRHVHVTVSQSNFL